MVETGRQRASGRDRKSERQWSRPAIREAGIEAGNLRDSGRDRQTERQ